MNKWSITFEQCGERKAGAPDIWTTHRVEIPAYDLEGAVAAFHRVCYINARLVSVARLPDTPTQS